MDLIPALQKFNRKERYWLVRNALGLRAPRDVGENSDFAPLDLAAGFVSRLTRAFAEAGHSIRIPENAWWAMDYHYDWLFGAVRLLNDPNGILKPAENNGEILAHNEDCDLVIAFDRTLILLEAKGVGSWGGKQFHSKASRFAKLQEFRAGTSAIQEIYAVFTSPKKMPDNLTESKQIIWMPMGWSTDGHFRIQRCTREGRPARGGRFWQIIDA